MRRLQIIDRILDALRASDTVASGGHMRPDGDCIGSQLALAYALKDAGKKVAVYNQDPMPDKLAFLDPHKILRGPQRARAIDSVVVVDCASAERLGEIPSSSKIDVIGIEG